MMNHDQRCVQCNEVPHQALTLICSNPNCRNLVCGTNSQRSHCIYHHLIRHGHRVLWNRTQQRAEICACAACGGTILGVEVAAVLRPIYNLLDRKCDHYMHGATCYYRGHHLDIESHVHRRHTFSGMFDQNRDGGLEYKTPDDDRDFMDVSGMRCFFCKDVPHQPLKLKCNGIAKCAHSICGTSRFRSNCIDKFLRGGAVVKWDMINESLLLSRCPSRDGGVTLIEMQSPEVTEYYNGKQRKCDWKGENGKQCDDRNFVEGNHYEIEEHIRSYHLHIEANEDDNVNDDGEGRGEGSGHEFDDDDPDNNEDAAMESDDQEQSTVSSVASCSRHKFQRKLAFLFGMSYLMSLV